MRTALAGLRYAAALSRSVRRPLGSDEARARVEEQLRDREGAFLATLEQAVYSRPSSPYRALLAHAGIEHGDAGGLVRDHGLEGALERLHEAGVYVTLEEFRCTTTIERQGLSLAPRPADFDGVVGGASIPSQSGGSTGRPRRSVIDLGHREQQSTYQRLFLDSFGLAGRPAAVWRAAPPGNAGLGTTSSFLRVGQPVERWFSQTATGIRGRSLKDFLLTAVIVGAVRAGGTAMPYPEHVPVTDPAPVAAWLAEKRRAGTPGLLNTTPSSAVRVCLEATRSGLDIGGSVFRLGGEALTEGKAAVLEASGVLAVSNYTMSEAGRIGIACAEGQAVDDLHVLTNALALIQRPRAVAGGGSVDALLLTSLRPGSPKLLLNAESDDYAVLERRPCGCLLGELGLTLHIRDIRSHAKLTSEGMSFLGSDVITLVDEVLPARFGGSAADYQLVEQEVDGLPRVAVRVSPAVGAVDEEAVIETVLAALGEGPGYRTMMAEVWRDGQILRVERREPEATVGGKVLPLHVIR